MQQIYPMKLAPHVVTPIWGRETWVLSTHANGSCTVQNGAYAGMDFAQLYREQPGLFGNACAGRDFPVLVKFIHARDDLSIQVHPRDSDTHVLAPGEAGKTECWFILHAEPGAKLVMGFQHAITPEQFAQSIEDGSLLKHTAQLPVQAGDFFHIPAGTLHAIGAGITLAEVQQNSDTTYRVFDYGRLQNGQLRELHVAQAKAVTDLVSYTAQPSDEYFTARRVRNPQGVAGESSFVSLVVLQGEGTLTCANQEPMSIAEGDSIFLPAGLGAYAVQGDCEILLTHV
ncbi:MAG: mannose-6-phosphate isomerase [Oscillospiraceae bacterium]|nr:mannose-6-phosphate isomerase [Oscillospiraceae bacterium]